MCNKPLFSNGGFLFESSTTESMPLIYLRYTKRNLLLHFPVTITIVNSKILLHTITDVISLFIGFRYYVYLKRKQGDNINTSNRLWIIIGATLGAFLGSRLLGGLENPLALVESQNILLYFYANKTIVGGLLGGLIGVELIKKAIKEKTASGDLFTYPLILAIIIGRVGCFSMGIYEETYGLPSSLPWAMNLGDTISRHPVCIYEIVFLIGLWLFIASLSKKYRLQNGAMFKIFMISYLCFRFLLDFIKPHYTYIFGLSTIQTVCLAGLIYYYQYIIHPEKLFKRELLNPLLSLK
jgi:prolipoprotein diacylglyceryltransferase